MTGMLTVEPYYKHFTGQVSSSDRPMISMTTFKYTGNSQSACTFEYVHFRVCLQAG